MSNGVVIFLTAILSVMLFLLTLFVLTSTTRPIVKFFFTIMTTTLGIWIIANTNADIVPASSLWWTRLAFVSAAITLGGLVGLVMYFPRMLPISSAVTICFMILSGAIALLSFTPLIVPEVRVINNYTNVIAGEMYWAYLVYVVFAALLSLGVLIYRRQHESVLNRYRIHYVLIGTVITLVIAGSTNLILPLLTGQNPLAIYGSFASLAFIAALAYSIVRHQLFSIRAATARAVVYLLSGATLGCVYAFVVFSLAGLLFPGETDSTASRVFYVLSAVILGYTFPAIKNFFTGITRKSLFRDIYDPEEILKKVATIVANSKSSTDLIQTVAKELKTKLHINFIEAYLLDEQQQTQRKVGRSNKKNQPNSLQSISELIAATKDSVIILEQDEIGTFKEENIGAILLLRVKNAVHGYFTLGYKESGTAFNSGDKSLFNAIANEVAVATENYLRYEAMEQFNQTLTEKIEFSTAELRESNQKLRSLDQSKDEFISMASHQLRTPLTTIKGYLSMVLDGDVGEITPQQRKVLEEAFGSSQRMVYLIGDFLNVSRLQTGKFELELRPTDLTEVISQEIHQLQETASTRQITLKYDQPHHFPIVPVDENKMRQVMMNFIDNAIFYSKADSSIVITLTQQDGDVVFKVVDQGIGVPATERHKLFTKFYRASNARKQRPDGTGIGLFMSRKVVVAHGGSIIFETTENKGSTFGFRLPLKNDSNQLKNQP